MSAAVFLQQVFHVLEKLYMPALVTGDGNALHVFLNGAFHNLVHAAVMAQVNDLRAFALQDAAHDVNGRVVAVEKRSGGNNTDFKGGLLVHIV